MTSLTGEEKAGLLLLSLDARVADAVLRQLGAQAKARLAGHMQRLGSSAQSKELKDQVLKEAEALLQNLIGQVGATDRVKPVENVAQPKAPDKLAFAKPDSSKPQHGLRIAGISSMAAGAQETESPDIEEADPTKALSTVSKDRLLVVLEGESPRTIAMILNCLAPDKAGVVFKELQPDLRREVSVQMGTCTMPTAAVVHCAVRAMLAKEQTLPETAGEAQGNARYKTTAQLLRKLERTDRLEALAALQERDAGAANQVREFLYQFEDLICLDGRSLQKVLGEVDGKTLAISMKGASEEIMSKVVENMSKRARDGMVEEMEFLGTVPLNQIRQARKAIVDAIQKLDQVGDIVMGE